MTPKFDKIEILVYNISKLKDKKRRYSKMEKAIKKTIAELYAEVLAYLTETKADAELIEFVAKRADLEVKAREKAKEKRLVKGGEKKDIAQSEFYSNIRQAITGALSTEFKTAKVLIAEAGVKALPAQVAIALKPMVADKTVLSDRVKVETVGKDGLKKEVFQTAFRLA